MAYHDKDKIRSSRYFRNKHQHFLTPFKTIAHLTITQDFNLTRFRRHLREKVKFPLYVKIELGKSGRPHFHIIAKQNVTHDEFKQLFQSCLQGEKIDLRVDIIENDKQALNWCWYVTKQTEYEGRCEFVINNFWTKKPAELRIQTPAEKRKSLRHIVLTDDLLHEYYLHSIIPEETLSKPNFFSLWKYCLKDCPDLRHKYEYDLILNEWDTNI